MRLWKSGHIKKAARDLLRSVIAPPSLRELVSKVCIAFYGLISIVASVTVVFGVFRRR
jgi:hypothetical protein